jgi:tetratricopeptide (TPR) repeat protein
MFLFFFILPSLLAQNNDLSLDAAIAAASKEIEKRIAPGASVAVSNIISGSAVLSDYIIEELFVLLMENEEISVIDKNTLNRMLVRAEAKWQLSGNISDRTQVSIGKLVDADHVVSGFFSVDSRYCRFRLSLFDVSLSKETGFFDQQVVKDNRVNTLLAAAKPVEKGINMNPLTAGEYSERADIYGNMGDYDRAIMDYSEAIKRNPKNIVILYGLRGCLYLAKKDYDRAVNDLSEAIRRNPNFMFVYYVRSRTYAFNREYDKALADCNIIIERTPNEVSSYISRGYVYVETGEYEKAIIDADTAINLDSDDSAGHAIRGVANMHLKYYQRALADMNRAIQLDPSNPDGYGNRGIIYFRTGDYVRAVADFERAYQLAPGDSGIRAWLERVRSVQNSR